MTSNTATDKPLYSYKRLGPVTTCHVDREGLIVKTNSRFEGMQPEHFVGLRLSDFIEEPSRSEYLQLLRNAVEKGEVGSYVNTIVSPTGNSQWVNRICPWREEGKIVGAIMIGNQIIE